MTVVPFINQSFYLVVEKLEIPARGSEATTSEPIQPNAIILAVVDNRNRLQK